MFANLGGGEDVLDGYGNLGTNTVTLDQADQVVALQGTMLVFDLSSRGRLRHVVIELRYFAEMPLSPR